MSFAPRRYQEIIRDFTLDHERCNVWAGMGMGKTSASLLAYAGMRQFKEARRALILAPRRVALWTWPDEREKWFDTFGHMTVAAAIGTPEQRLAALRANADITTINYDNIEWLIEACGDHWPFDTVFADESPRLKGLRIKLVKHPRTGKAYLTGQGAKRAYGLAKTSFRHVRRWVNLTGSPAPNGLADLWGQQWFVDHGQRLGFSFTDFERRWFHHVPDDDGRLRLVPTPYAEQHIKEALRDCTITLDPKDWFDIRQPIERIIPIKLPAKARRAYDTMQDEFFAEVRAAGADGDEIYEVEALSSSSKLGKCLQIAGGAVYVDDQKNWAAVHDEKLEALRSVVEETNGEPLLVRYVFQHERDRILKAFPRFKPMRDDRRLLDDWNAGRVPGIVMHAQSAGHGLNMQDGGRILVDYTTDYNLEHDEQIIERIGPVRQLQAGHNRAVMRYRLVAEQTVEDGVMLPCVRRKTRTQDAIKDYMKKQGW